MRAKLATSLLTVFVIGNLAKAADAPAYAPLRSIAIRVIDDTGAPVSNAFVDVNNFYTSRTHSGITDANGLFKWEDRLACVVYAYVKKAGWYYTGGKVWSSERQSWKDFPTNSLIVQMKPIINPVPMAFRRIVTSPPRLDEFISFDLAVGDWVAPDGKGIVKDVFIKAEKYTTAQFDFDFSMTMMFSNKLDGIQNFEAAEPHGDSVASDLLPPYKAPLDGYTNVCDAIVKMRPNAPPTLSRKENRNYIFRVRSKTDTFGKIVTANYGWIWGDFKIGPTRKETGRIMFNYYYNPNSNSCSLEPNEIADRQGKYLKE